MTMQNAVVMGSRTRAVGKTIHAFLDEHPDLAHSPAKVAAALGVKIGSAKSFSKAWRDGQKLGLLSPTYLQNIRFFGRTPPGTSYPGSPPPGWQDRGDNKLTRTVAFPPDGHMDVGWAPNGGAEITLAAPRGLTPSEALQAFAFAKAILPMDPDFAGKLSFEVLRDGGAVRLDGLEAVTLRTAESLLLKAYRHSDRRGEALRIEIRTPVMNYTLREAEAMLTDRRPLGRDSAIERLSLQVEEMTRATMWTRKEILHLRRAIDEFRTKPEAGR
jgi:hypothetical protein